MTRDTPVDHAFACESCGHAWYYTRPRCPSCQSTSTDIFQLEAGELLATTTVHATPPGVREPNYLGLVRFESGVSLVAQLEDDYETGDVVTFGDVAVLRVGESEISGPRLSRREGD